MTKIFDSKGMLIIPSKPQPLAKAQKLLIAGELYCPNGHNLISRRAVFNGHPGIMLKVKQGRKQGLIALSPVYGEKVRVALAIDLIPNEIVELRCPQCNVLLPAWSKCSCGADVIAMFLQPRADFSNCIGVCNRVDCTHAQVTQSGELISQAMIEAY